MGEMVELILVGVLVLCSAFFSSSETALTALGKFKIKAMIEEGKKGAVHVEKITKDKDKLLSSILIGSNFSNITLGAIMTAFTISIAGDSAASIAIATVIATLIVLIFGEITPKIVAIKHPEKMALFLAAPLRLVMKVLSPIASLLNLIIALLLRPFGFSDTNAHGGITESELKSMLKAGYEEGALEHDEHKMIGKVMEFDDVLAKDIMTPRTDMVAIDVDSTYNDVMSVFRESRFSRLPVYQEDIDHIVGVLHIKDFILADVNDDTFSIKNYMREPFFTLERKRVREVFAQMREANSSLAIVLDEYGGTDGLLSIEDLTEEIVGEIFDEHDAVRNYLERVSDSEYIVDGAIKLDDFHELTGINLFSAEYESVGGYVMGLVGSIPKVGASIQADNVVFEVIEIERNSIERLRIKFEGEKTQND